MSTATELDCAEAGTDCTAVSCIVGRNGNLLLPRHRSGELDSKRNTWDADWCLLWDADTLGVA